MYLFRVELPIKASDMQPWNVHWGQDKRDSQMASGITIELNYMSPVPQPRSASDFLLLIISSIADTPTINKDLASLTFSSINLWTITTSILLRWRLSLSLTVPNVFIGILILYLCVKLFAEPVEKVPGHLNPFAKRIVAVQKQNKNVVTSQEQCQSKSSRWLRPTYLGL